MTKLISFILLLFFIFPAFSQPETKNPTKILVKVNLNYKKNKNGYIDQTLVNNELKMKVNTNHWTMIYSLQSKHNTMTLLSKIENANSKKATIKFKLLDSSKNSNIQYKPKIIVLYGKKTRLVCSRKDEKIELIVYVTK